MLSTQDFVGRPTTLSHALFPQQTLLRHAVLVLAASLFIALAAQVSIRLPLGPVPITGQTFAVLMVGGLLGSRLGLAAGVLYLAEGIAGLPVYANGSSGWAVVTGSTGGYLFAFPLAALLVGWLTERGWDRRPLTLFGAMLLGSIVTYSLGLTWLYAWGSQHTDALKIEHMTLGLTLKWGLFPFVPGDLAKLALAAGLVPSGWGILRAVKLGPDRVLHGKTSGPVAAAWLGPVAIGAGLAMALGAILPWSPGTLGIAGGAGWVVFVAGLTGAFGAAQRSRRAIARPIAELWGFAAAGIGGLTAFVNLVEFTKAGDLGLADISVGVVIATIASLVLLASTAWDTTTS